MLVVILAIDLLFLPCFGFGNHARFPRLVHPACVRFSVVVHCGLAAISASGLRSSGSTITGQNQTQIPTQASPATSARRRFRFLPCVPYVVLVKCRNLPWLRSSVQPFQGEIGEMGGVFSTLMKFCILALRFFRWSYRISLISLISPAGQRPNFCHCPQLLAARPPGCQLSVSDNSVTLSLETLSKCHGRRQETVWRLADFP